MTQSEPEQTPTIELAMARVKAGDAPAAAGICRELLKEAPEDVEALHLLGVILIDMELPSEAINFLTRAMAVAPNDASVLFNLGIALRAQGRIKNAAWAFHRATEEAGLWPDAWYNLGEACRRLERMEDARAAFGRVVELAPENMDAWFNLANTLSDLGLLDESVEAYGTATRLDPNHFEAINNLGIALRLAERPGEAVEAFQKAIAIQPTHAGAEDNLGNALMDMERHEEAIHAFLRAIRLVPGYADAHFNLGNVYRQTGKGAEAAICYQTALDIRPQFQAARSALGLALHEAGRLDEAEAPLHQICMETPEDANAQGNLGNLLRDKGDFEAALTCLDRAVELAPGNAKLAANRAFALLHAHRLEDAIAAYGQAIKLDPESEPLQSNLAQALLLAGRFAEGWAAFEARLQALEISEVLSRLPGRVWTGGEVVGKHLLLASEQGLGDAIQFARYAQLLGEAGAKVSLACHPRLVRLLQSLPGAVDIQPIDGRLPKADLHAPLLSLPHLGGTLFEAIPAPIPYLTPEPDLVRHWTERLGEGLKIGLAWQGNPAYEGDRTRSIPLARLAPLCEASGTRFFSLQTELGRDQLDRLGHARIEDLGDELDRDHAFIDTAAVMGNLDLVITSDTAIPHLAGALGRPVWLLLPHTPDWRWGLEGTLCPWYPTMRLIRQPAPGDWRGAVDQAQAALDHWLTRGGAPNQAFDDLF